MTRELIIKELKAIQIGMGLLQKKASRLEAALEGFVSTEPKKATRPLSDDQMSKIHGRRDRLKKKSA